jgi:hypothetical protein
VGASLREYAPFCASCIRSDVPLSLVEIDGKHYRLCPDHDGSGAEEPTPPRTTDATEPTATQLVERFLRHTDGASASEILLALGCPGDNKEADTVRKAISRLRERGVVEAIGQVDTRGLAMYRLARRR